MTDKQTVIKSFAGSRAYTLTEEEATVLHAIRNMKYGAIEITLHDSRIVQVQKTEKMRFGR